MSTELQYARALVTAVRARAAVARRNGRSEIGASALEWAIISAIIAGLAIFVAQTIYDKVAGKATEIDVG